MKKIFAIGILHDSTEKFSFNNFKEVQVDLDELIVLMFERWIEMEQPKNRIFKTNMGQCTAHSMLTHIKLNTSWGKGYKTRIRLNYLQSHNQLFLTPELKSEEIVYALIDASMKRLEVHN